MPLLHFTIGGILIGAGAVGLGGMTFAFPLLGGFIRLFFPHDSGLRRDRARVLQVLIPAHNEEILLTATIRSIQESLQALRPGASRPALKILVGADSCDDRTEEAARSGGADVRSFSFRSKWNVIHALLKALAPSQSPGEEWVALVDAGAIWPKGLLRDLFSEPIPEDIAGIAPSYHPRRVGKLHSLHWGVERLLKRIESSADGPVSVHGATVFYRRAELFRAMKALEGRAWLNDDVVLPLMIRLQNPSGRILYFAGGGAEQRISDQGISRPRNEFLRRRRLVLGNLEWIRHFYPALFSQAPLVGILSLRRFFRVFWAYWLLFLALGIGMETHSGALGPRWVLLLGACLGIVSCKFKSVAASFLAPLYLLSTRRAENETWG